MANKNDPTRKGECPRCHGTGMEDYEDEMGQFYTQFCSCRFGSECAGRFEEYRNGLRRFLNLGGMSVTEFDEEKS